MNELQQKIYDTVEEMHVLERNRRLNESRDRGEITQEDIDIVLQELNK